MTMGLESAEWATFAESQLMALAAKSLAVILGFPPTAGHEWLSVGAFRWRVACS